jgi:hypothetical protein
MIGSEREPAEAEEAAAASAAARTNFFIVLTSR